jgi:hypothetical protein
MAGENSGGPANEAGGSGVLPAKEGTSYTSLSDQADVKSYKSMKSSVFDMHTPYVDGSISISTTLIIWTMSAIPFSGIIMGFSGIGYGTTVFATLVDLYDWTGLVVPATLLLLLTLYLFDFTHWDTRKGWVYALKAICTMLALALLGACAAFASREYPPLLMAYVILLIPGWFYLVRCVTDSSAPDKEDAQAHLFLQKIAGPLLLCSVVIFIYWFVWVLWAETPDVGDWNSEDSRGHFYSKSTATFYAVRLGCVEESDMVAGESLDCTLAYLIWIAPFIISITAGFGGLTSYFLYRTKKKIDSGSSARYGKLKVFSIVLLAILGSLWVAASVAGAGQLSSAFYALAAAGITVLCLIVVAAFGVAGLEQEVGRVPILKAVMDEVVHGEILKGLFVITCFIPIVLYLLLSVVNQCVRKWVCTGCCDIGLTTFSNDDAAQNGHLGEGAYLTKSASALTTRMRQWHWVNVLVYAVYWGIFFVVVQVGIGLVTTVFLSWLNDTLAPLNLVTTVVIFYVVGFTMFLLPPVPGVPVYLAGGVIIVNAAEDTMGFTGAIAFMVLLGWTLKMLAITFQQKIFGEKVCQSFVSARAFVQINSTSMRAVRKILSRPGMTLAKVSILVGGPDWPTSVLTGIMGLDLLEMLWGSQPIIFLIIPCVVAGAFLLKTGGVWDSLGGITLTVSAVTQVGAMVAAAYYIQEEVESFPDPDPDFKPDLEVQALDKKTEVEAKKYKIVTATDRVPAVIKCVLFVAFLAQAGVVYLVGLLYTSCFEPFEVSSSIEEDLDGNVLNVIKTPYGYMAILLFGISMVALWVFRLWAGCEMKKVQDDEPEPPSFQPL